MTKAQWFNASRSSATLFRTARSKLQTNFTKGSSPGAVKDGLEL